MAGMLSAVFQQKGEIKMPAKHHWFNEKTDEEWKQGWQQHIQKRYHSPQKINLRESYDRDLNKPNGYYGKGRSSYGNPEFNQSYKDENDDGRNVMKKSQNQRLKLDKMAAYKNAVDEYIGKKKKTTK